MARANYAMNLDGPNNVRDLGGYPTQDGKLTKWKQFLRSDNPYFLSDYDCETLYRYGVRLAIDLRSDFECDQQPHGLNGYKDVEYLNLQLQDNMNSNQGNIAMPDSMSDVYIGLINDSQAKYAELFRAVLRHPDDCVMFNCTGGKDRAGTTAALILKIANCSDDVITSDYAATYDNIRRDAEKSVKMFEERGLVIKPEMMRSDPETMQAALDALTATYGTIDNWLIRCGLTAEEIAGLRAKIVAY